MGKRKDRILAAMSNAGRRVKLDLSVEPSGTLLIFDLNCVCIFLFSFYLLTRVLFYVLFLLIREVFLKMGWFRKILVPSALFFHFYFVNFVFVLCLGLGIRVLFYALFMLVSG